MNLAITLDNSDRATRAATWCKRRRIDYDMEYWGWPSKTQYRFIFKQENDMLIFSLKWA